MDTINMQEYVVLVDAHNRALGTALKSQIHTDHTPMHRAFSTFIFNSKGELLLNQRALTKITWPGVWSNSCCGHPAPGESFNHAVKRRVKQELGLTLKKIHKIIPNYTYRTEKDGIVEHEFCPVFVSFSDEKPVLNPAEVEAVRWVNWKNFVQEIKNPNDYSAWCVEETLLLDKNQRFNQLYLSIVSK